MSNAEKLVEFVGNYINEATEGVYFDTFGELVKECYGNKKEFLEFIYELLLDALPESEEIYNSVQIDFDAGVLLIFDEEKITEYNKFYKMLKAYCKY